MKTIESVQNRPLQMGQAVEVYFHFRKRVFSIKDKRTGLVVAYAPVVVLSGPISFKVSEKGRQRVLRDQQKNVHAFVCGLFLGTDLPGDAASFSAARYNPYRSPYFTDALTGESVQAADRVFCAQQAVWYQKNAPAHAVSSRHHDMP